MSALLVRSHNQAVSKQPRADTQVRPYNQARLFGGIVSQNSTLPFTSSFETSILKFVIDAA